MNCEFYRTEMYSWRPESDPKNFQPLFRHLESCSDCARQFERLTAQDEEIRRTLQKLPDTPHLEGRIRAGLAHERGAAKAVRGIWKPWLLLPIAAILLLAVALGLASSFQQHQLSGAVAGLLSTPPALQVVSNDRSVLLRWSAGTLSRPLTLPPELDRVQFRGAAAVRVGEHKAVLLRMKNEPRASLLIMDLDTRFVYQHNLRDMHEKTGSAALWSDQNSTYILLFEGNMQDMHAYMEEMGISA